MNLSPRRRDYLFGYTRWTSPQSSAWSQAGPARAKLGRVLPRTQQPKAAAVKIQSDIAPDTAGSIITRIVARALVVIGLVLTATWIGFLLLGLIAAIGLAV